MSAYKRTEYEYTEKEKQIYWNLSNGLQAVDNLKPSEYLLQQQKEEIAGNISIYDVKANVERYHDLRSKELAAETKEADMVSIRISEYLRTFDFRLHPLTLKKIHGFIFEGLDEFNPGCYRDYNFSKEEPILFGKSVRYEDYTNIEDFLEYDIEKEIKAAVTGKGFDLDRFVDFISGIWQIHPFCEGNTRTIAVFSIQYLTSLGFMIHNEPFADNAKYFRDALVRACYNDMENRVSPDTTYILKFFQNVLYNQNHLLDSKNLIVNELSYIESDIKQPLFIHDISKSGCTKEEMDEKKNFDHTK